MDDLDKILVGIFGIVALGSCIYQGYFAWFHPAEFKIILIQNTQRRSSWPFPKEALVEFNRKYGVWMARFGNVLLTIIILIIEANVFLNRIP